MEMRASTYKLGRDTTQSIAARYNISWFSSSFLPSSSHLECRYDGWSFSSYLWLHSGSHAEDSKANLEKHPGLDPVKN